MKINIQYSQRNFFSNSFVDAKRHFQVAFCSAKKINQLASKGVICGSERDHFPKLLTFKERVQHLTLALLESIGILFFAVSLLVDYIGRRLHLTLALKTSKNSAPSTYELFNLISKRIDKLVPSNSIEYFVKLVHEQPENFKIACEHFGLCDQHLLKAYHEKKDVASGMNCVSVNILLSYYLGLQKGYPYLSTQGEYSEIDPSGKIVYTPLVFSSDTPNAAKDLLHLMLNLELTKNSGKRPKKIMVPMSWNDQGMGHNTLLIIEPSSENERAARITMINTNGNSPKRYIAYEKAVMKAARQIYNAAETTVVRNKIPIYTTGTSCGHDMIELACELAEVDNAQETVQQGLTRKSREDDCRIRLKHGEDIKRFFDHYRAV